MKFTLNNFWNLLLPYFLIYIVGGIISIPSIYLKFGDSSIDAFIKNLAFFPIIFLSIYILKHRFIHIYRIAIADFKSQGSFNNFITGVGFCLAFIISAVTLTYILGGVKFLKLGSSVFFISHITKDFLLIGLISNFIVCYTEELLFRVFLINYLNQFKTTFILPVILSSIIFAIGHFNYASIIDTVIAFVGGLVLGYVYQVAKSIYLCIGIHFAYNLYNYTLTTASSDKNDIAYRPFFLFYSKVLNSPVYMIDVFIFLAFVTMLLVLSRNNNLILKR